MSKWRKETKDMRGKIMLPPLESLRYNEAWRAKKRWKREHRDQNKPDATASEIQPEVA